MKLLLLVSLFSSFFLYCVDKNLPPRQPWPALKMIVHASSVKMNLELYSSIYKLYQEFAAGEQRTCSEFISERWADSYKYPDNLLQYFANLVNHEKFLRKVGELFIGIYKPMRHSTNKLVMFLFFTIFGTQGHSFDELFALIKAIKYSFKLQVLDFVVNEENLTRIALIGCKNFDDAHVLKEIIEPILAQAKNLGNISETLKNEILIIDTKPATVPLSLTVLNRPKKAPNVPLNTPIKSRVFLSQPVPMSLYLEDDTQKLASLYEKNRQKAIKLLATAKGLASNGKTKVRKEVPEEMAPKFKAKKAPCSNQVHIKGNIATTLREANVAMKEQEQEIQTIETILKGGAVLDKYRQLEEDARKEEQQRLVNEVEKRHLEGLLTFEESILAKKKLIEENKERFRLFQEEREEFLAKLENWREEEEIKMKILVQRGRETEHNARQSELKLKEDKKKNVYKIKSERKDALEKLYEKNRAELAKKMKLIEEIKTLHQIKMLNNAKKMAEVKGPELGLLCQMSVVELQERLEEAKERMEAQLAQKRRCIIEHKAKRREMIENVKNFIAQSRMSKPKSVPIRPPKLERSPDLDKLRRHLEYVRELRKTGN